MRQFYLAINSSGYYRVFFIDPVTGKQDSGKSTHSKDKVEATMIATFWLQNGVPAVRGNSRQFGNNALSCSTPLNLSNIVERLSQPNNVQVIQQSPVNIIQTKTSKPRIRLCEYLLNFWDYDNSEFIKRYLAHGNNMTKKHAQNMISLVKNYWQSYFGNDVFVDDLDKTVLDDFFFFLYCEKGLKGETVNKAINVGSRAMGYHFEDGKIE